MRERYILVMYQKYYENKFIITICANVFVKLVLEEALWPWICASLLDPYLGFWFMMGGG
jgi:hypothetical protein